jgi:hypothetical protein
MSGPGRTRLNQARPRRLLLVLLAYVLACVLGGGSARGEVASDGLAGAYTLRARGVDAPSWNPATLAWGSRLSISVVSAHAALRNNSFTLGDYNDFNGRVWNEDDKQGILDRIPGSAFEGKLVASASLPGVAWKGWAFTVVNVAVGRACLPKDFARLILYGNDPNREFTLQGSDGDGIAWSEFRLSHGREVAQFTWDRSDLGRIALAAGASLKIVRGWGYGEVLRVSGGLQTSLDGVTGESDLWARSAAGGNGFSLDLGLAARSSSGWDAALAVQNPISSVTWSRTPQEHLERATANQISLGDMDQDVEDLIVDTTFSNPIASFKRSLPANLTLAAGHRVGPTYVEGDLRQGFADRAGSSTSPRLALGVAYPPLKWIEGRGGLAFGGGDGVVFAGGVGFALWAFRLDLAGSSIGRGNPFSPKGLGAGLSLALDWGGTR